MIMLYEPATKGEKGNMSKIAVRVCVCLCVCVSCDNDDDAEVFWNVEVPKLKCADALTAATLIS